MFKITLQVFFYFLSKYYAKEFIIAVGVMHQASQDRYRGHVHISSFVWIL